MQGKLVATVKLYRMPDGRYVARGPAEDRDIAEVEGAGASAEEALTAAGRDYDQAGPGDPETVRM